jgi:hypothetical protein
MEKIQEADVNKIKFKEKIKRIVSLTLDYLHEEEFDVDKTIADFINNDWSKDDDSRGKALNMLKGLIYNDSPEAKKFIKDLDKKSNELNPEDY